MTKVSVLMPVHGDAPYLEEALLSTLSQALADELEVVVVDDRMTEASRTCVRGFQDQRVRLVLCEGSGLVDALNTGLQVCRYPYVARMDADDVMRPGRLGIQAAWLETHGDVGVVSGQLEWINEHGATIGFRSYPLRHREIMRQMRARNAIAHPAAMFRAEVVREAGGYRHEFVGAEDYDLWLRIADRNSLANLPDVVLRYRIHAAQVTRSRRETVAESTYLAQWAARSRRAGQADAPLPWTQSQPPHTALVRLQRFRVRAFARFGFRADEEPELICKLGFALVAAMLRPLAFYQLVLERREARQQRSGLASSTFV